MWIAAGGGLGFLPWAPGTFGSLAGLALAWALTWVPNIWLHAGVILGLALVGVPICAIAMRQLGGEKDPSCIVFDEIVGMAATLFGFDAMDLLTVVTAFVLFRVFDVLKPPPVLQVEELPHGWGIMADDLVAAIYASLSLWLLLGLVGWTHSAGPAMR